MSLSEGLAYETNVCICRYSCERCSLAAAAGNRVHHARSCTNPWFAQQNPRMVCADREPTADFT